MRARGFSEEKPRSDFVINARKGARVERREFGGISIAKGPATFRCVLADPSLSSPAPEILDYLARHPDARDTIDGIYWWVLDACIQNWAPQIPRSVAQLVERGFLLQEEPSKDGKVFYRISPRYLSILQQRAPLAPDRDGSP